MRNPISSKNDKKILFKDFLFESTYYNDPATKQAFLSDLSNIGTGFMFSFLGMLGLLNGAKNKNALLSYFKKDKKLRISTIADDNNNSSLIIKLMDDVGAFKSSAASAEITRFLVLLRSGNIDTVNDSIVKGWIGNIQSAWISKNLDGRLKGILKEFEDTSGTLQGLATRLIKIRSSYPDIIVDEFSNFARQCQFEKKTGQKLMPGVDDNDQDAQSTSIPVPPPPPPINKGVILNKDDILMIFNNTSDLYIFFKKDEEQRKLLKLIMSTISNDYVKNSYMSDKEFPNANEIGKMDPTKKNILDSYLIPFFKSLSLEEFEKVFNRFNKLDLENNQNPSDSEKYFRKVMISNHENVINYLSKLVKTLYPPSHYIFQKIIQKTGESFKEEFGSFENLFNQIYEKFKDDLQIIYRAAWDFIEDNDKVYNLSQSEKESLSRIALKSLLDRITKEGSIVKMIGNYTLKNIFFQGTSHLEKFWSESEIESFVTEVKKILSSKAASYTKELDAIIENVCFELEKNNAKKLSNAFKKHFSAEYSDFKLKEINIEDNSVIISKISKLPTTKETFFETLLLVVDRVSKQTDHLDEFQKRFIFEGLLRSKGLMKSFKSADELNDIFEKYVRVMNVDDRNDLYTSTYDIMFEKFNFHSNDSISKTESRKFALDMMIYKDDHFPEPVGRGALEYTEKLLVNGLFDNVDEQQSLKIMQQIIQNPNGYFGRLFSKDNIKAISKRDLKTRIKDFYFGLIFDNIDKNPHLVNQLYEVMEPTLQNQVRSQMISANTVLQAVQHGVIQPFEKLSKERLKEILSFNNINVEEKMKDFKQPRKSKNQPIADYLNIIKGLVSEYEKTVVGQLKVTEDVLSVNEKLEINVDLVEKTHAGRHGNVYPKIHKSFSVSLPTDKYEEFAAEMERLGIQNEHIVPAFHGTGGIAASMILRYGFKVVDSSDPSVVGRALGDGIYFAINIDKSLQYVGNQGYGRGEGTKGYIFVMDAQLGKKGEHHQYAGPDTKERFLSPEWAVRDGNAQLKIMTAYEVELVTNRTYMIDVKSKLQNESFSSFKEFYMLNEKEIENPNQQRFIFWDGNIPTLDKKVLPFEKVKKLGNSKVRIEKTPNGPAVVFLETKRTACHDVRYANTMKDNLQNLYFKLLAARQ